MGGRGGGIMPKECVLIEAKTCDNCGECMKCDLDPMKFCDNCGRCIESADYRAIEITEIRLEPDKPTDSKTTKAPGKPGRDSISGE